MCRTARRAELDFTKLVSQSGSSLYLERFLADGFQALNTAKQNRFSSLRHWTGIGGLQKDVSTALGQPAAFSEQIFSQSRCVAQLASECICNTAKRVLVTDLAWPSYIKTLRARAIRTSVEVHACRLKPLLRQNASSDDVLRCLTDSFSTLGCDAAFLSDISYQGIRLPIRKFRRAIGEEHAFVVDGSQAVGHAPVDLTRMNCDMYITGVQKWIGGFHPLRIATFGNPEFARLGMSATETMGDPLNQFCRSLRSQTFDSLGETVSILPLLTAAAAFREHVRSGKTSRNRKWQIRLDNSKWLVDFLGDDQWQTSTGLGLESGIVLLRPKRPATNVSTLRKRLASFGVVATTYEDGSIRMAMPSFHLSLQQMTTVFRALNLTRQSTSYPPPSRKPRIQSIENIAP